MKIILHFLLIVLPLFTFGQDLKCCETTEEIQSVMTGDWKLKKSELNSRFNYTFKDTTSVCSVSHSVKINDEYETTTDFPQIEILKGNGGYEITFNYPKFFWTAKIEALNSRKMILGINGNQLIFSKTN